MFDVGAGEILLIVVLAIIVIGPQDLPRTMRAVGAFARKARGVVLGFQETLEDFANRSDLDEFKRRSNQSQSQSSESRVSTHNPPKTEVETHSPAQEGDEQG